VSFMVSFLADCILNQQNLSSHYFRLLFWVAVSVTASYTGLKEEDELRASRDGCLCILSAFSSSTFAIPVLLLHLRSSSIWLFTTFLFFFLAAVGKDLYVYYTRLVLV